MVELAADPAACAIVETCHLIWETIRFYANREIQSTAACSRPGLIALVLLLISVVPVRGTGEVETGAQGDGEGTVVLEVVTATGLLAAALAAGSGF